MSSEAFGMLARFVIRPHSVDQPGGDILIGLINKKSDGKSLKPGTIYQITEILGTLQIIEIGPAAIKSDPKKSLTYSCWAQRLDQVITSGVDWLLTEKEATRSADNAQPTEDAGT